MTCIILRITNLMKAMYLNGTDLKNYDIRQAFGKLTIKNRV